MKIEITLFGVIGLMILLDFFLKRSKENEGADELVKVDVHKQYFKIIY